MDNVKCKLTNVKYKSEGERFSIFYYPLVTSEKYKKRNFSEKKDDKSIR